jgi:hypothetical protein
MLPARREHGFVLSIAVFLAALFALIVLQLVQHLRTTSQQAVYLGSISRAYQLAETGQAAAMGQLASSSDLSSFTTSPVIAPDGSGEYQNTVMLKHVPVDPIYYVVTSATHTVGGHSYSCRLHSYVRVSNTAEFFMATPDELTISQPIDVSTGRIYAGTITFITNGGTTGTTRVLRADYLSGCFQQTPPAARIPWAAPSDVIISQPPGGNPVQAAAPLLFPQLLDADLFHYQNLAGPHVTQQVFSGDIYPPGYSDYSTNQTGDVYTGHTQLNSQHVYYSTGDMMIQGTVHGQVLFVAAGNIHITGNLLVATDTSWYPGQGMESSSTAHQAVLMTRGNVIIDNTLPVNPPAVTTLSIQAMIIAPYGTLVPTSYGDDMKHSALALDFLGSMIVGTPRSTPSLPSIFRYSRTYGYMTSLKTNPPPDLPSLAEIYCALEETGASR